MGEAITRAAARVSTDRSTGLAALRMLSALVQERPLSCITFGLLAIPLGSLVYFLFAAGNPADPGTPEVSAFLPLGSLNAILALAALIALLSFLERSEFISQDREQLRRRESDHLTQIHRLENEMELLLAMREVSRIVNDDVRFERIWKKVLRIVRSLVDYEEVTILLPENGADGPLIPRVHHRNGKTFFGAEIDPARIGPIDTEWALNHRSVYHVVENDLLNLFFPLSTDQEYVGVLKVAVPLAGSAEKRTERIEECQAVLSDLLKHISLAIKTPTLYDMAVVDQLTGLYTKRFFVQEINRLMRVSRRHETVFTLILIDIDHFKSVNDQHGHLTGDLVLQSVAECTQRVARESDSCYRYGGEELCLLLPETDIVRGCRLAERLRQNIEHTEHPGEGGHLLQVTISLGVASYDSHLESFPELVSQADQALYRAKETGRNRVWHWGKNGPVSNTARPPHRRRSKSRETAV